MRRIFTSLLSLALLITISNKALAQTCNYSATAPVGVSFGTSLNVTLANGFTGTNTGTDGLLLTYPSNATSSVTSPIYYYQDPAATIHFRFQLDPANGSQPPVTPTITINYGVGGSQSIVCAGTAFTLPSQNSGTYYFSITPAAVFPNNTNFTVRLQLATGNRVIIAENFSTNATLAGSNAALPVKFGLFNATASSNGVELKWTIDAEENTKNYEVERSADGRNYNSVGKVSANGTRTYSFTDKEPIAEGFYRIKAVDFDGKWGYSSVVRIKGNESSVIVKAFMSNKNQLTVQHDAAAGSRINIIGGDGTIIRTATVAPGTQQTIIDLSSAKPGLLIVRFETTNGAPQSIRLIKY